MKTGLPAGVRAWVALSLSAFLFSGEVTDAAGADVDHRSARVTRVIKEVKVAAGPSSLRTASLNDRIVDGNTVRTGVKARTELTFPNRTIARLGANTVCSLTESAQSLQLNEGAVLFQAPDIGDGVKIRTGGITAALDGTTGLIERHQNYYVKILVLEGTTRVYLNQLGESVLVTAGQMLITKPGTKTLPEAVHFDIAQLYKTSLLTNADFQPLASRAAIFSEIQKQQSDPAYIKTNLVIHGRGTLVNLIPPTATTGKPSTPVNSPAPKRNLPSKKP